MDAEKFGAFIAKCRKEKHMTQSDLAVKLQVTDKAVSRWERGVGFPDINTLEPLAEALDVSVPELMKSEKMKKENVSVQEEEDVVTDTLQIAVSQKNKWKKTIAIFMFVIGGLLITMKLLEKAITFFIQGAIENVNASVSIIGGADGPTAILVASSGPFSWFPLIIGVVLVIIGIIVIKKR